MVGEGIVARTGRYWPRGNRQATTRPEVNKNRFDNVRRWRRRSATASQRKHDGNMFTFCTRSRIRFAYTHTFIHLVATHAEQKTARPTTAALHMETIPMLHYRCARVRVHLRRENNNKYRRATSPVDHINNCWINGMHSIAQRAMPRHISCRWTNRLHSHTHKHTHTQNTLCSWCT